MSDEAIYCERIKSNKTTALFEALSLLFLLVFIWRLNISGLDLLAGIFGGLFLLFLFYIINYRTLIIRLTDESLKLTFGLFSWTVPLKNVRDYRLDDLPFLMRNGGAGIHFMSVRKRYRAFLNFLEYPRVVIALKTKVGPVRDISFSTRQPEEILRIMEARGVQSSHSDIVPLSKA